MQWKEIFPSFKQPSIDEIADYIGGDTKELWLSLIKYMESDYHVKPTLSDSACAANPGWNVKFQKNGQSFGTLYPEENAFSVMIIISYKLDPLMQSILPDLSPKTAELYNKAGDYMKMGKWIMFQINDSTTLEDYKKILTVKLQPKVK
ncbi:MAG: DUF3788 domain-containing protein [Bacilli bacterium]